MVFEGASASEPIAEVAAPSKICVQFVPPSTVRYTPPCAVPRYALFVFIGSITNAVARPLTASPPVTCPFGIGFGPSAVHEGTSTTLGPAPGVKVARCWICRFRIVIAASRRPGAAGKPRNVSTCAFRNWW